MWVAEARQAGLMGVIQLCRRGISPIFNNEFSFETIAPTHRELKWSPCSFPMQTICVLTSESLVRLGLGMLLFLMVSVYTVYSVSTRVTDEYDFALIPVIIIVAVMGVTGSYFIFRMRIQQLEPRLQLEEKLNEYRTALIIKFALIEIPALAALVAYMISGLWLFVLLAVLLIGYFAFQIPLRKELIKDLRA